MHFVRFLIIIILCLGTLPLFAQPINSDDLRQEIEHASGETKLKLMLKLANLNAFSHELYNNAKALNKEAKEQNNMRYVAVSNVLKARYFYIINDLDSTIYYADLTNEIYQKNEINNPNNLNCYYLALVYFRRCHYYLAAYNLNLYIEKNQDSITAYQMQGFLYFLIGKIDLAKEKFQKAVDLFEQTGDTSARGKIDIYNGLSIILHYNKEYESALEICSIMNDIVYQNLNKLTELEKNRFLFQIYHLYSNIYVGMEDAEKAKFYLDKQKEISKDDIGDVLHYEMISTLGEYYALVKDYNRSLSYLDESLAFFEKKDGDKQIYIEILGNKVDVLEHLNRYSDAISTQKKLMLYKDSINNGNLPLQMSQLAKNYELDNIRVEQQKDKALLDRSRAVIFGLLAAIFLLFIILYLVRRHSKETKTKNEILFKQYVEVDKYIILTRERLVEEKKNKETIKKEPSLFDKIDEYMSVCEVYKNPDLTREDIAEALNTNWLYVVDAIKDETGKTFFDYVNEYRLNYARLQLMEEEPIPVGNIILDSGFSSNSTFYRLFKKRFGISPNELRQIKAEFEHNLISSN